MKHQERSEGTDAEMQRLIEQMQARLRENKRIRRNLPGGGRIHIDRALPFLCVYRQPPKKPDLGTKQLVMSEASYIVATGGRKQSESLQRLILGVGDQIIKQYGVCMVLEIWAGPSGNTADTLSLNALKPQFKIVTSGNRLSPWFLHRFEEVLGKIKVSKRKSIVELQSRKRCAPMGRAPLLDSSTASENGYRLFGLEVAPVYRDPVSGELFPLVLREQRQALSKALRTIFFDFVRTFSTHPASHRHALGRRAMVKAVWEADRILAEVSSSFDFLLQVSPVNVERSWSRFKKNHCDKRPLFQYRPTPFEPITLKRKLYRAPVEKIEDPALALIFRQKLTELDRQITLQQDRNTPRFIHESAQLYGEVSDSLVQEADRLLEEIPPRSRESSKKDTLNAQQFADLAMEHLRYYQARYPALNARVEVRDDISGLMVSRGSLLISRHAAIPASRVDALLQHEIGTHVLTYHNGKAQPLHLLYSGLAGYDAFQEGLAVLSEYLVGGLSKPRVRLLAGRVKAARNMIDGAGFVENFRMLNRDCGFNERTAYTITARIHRGGGLTKDAVYLEGLRKILEYIPKGVDLATVFVGKMGLEHIPIIRELLWRGVLIEPPLKPQYLERPDVLSRLDWLRQGVTVLDLVRRRR